MMKTIASAEAKSHFGAWLDTAQREPVMIEKKGGPSRSSYPAKFRLSRDPRLRFFWHRRMRGLMGIV
jgi:hypothetical protein